MSSEPLAAAGNEHVGPRSWPRGELALAGLAFLLSGASALVYQVAWQRILALRSGVGIYSVAMIVAAFMAGLGLGSHAGGALSERVSARKALRVFATLELAIGTFGLLSCLIYYDWLYLRGSWLYGSAWGAGLLHFLALLLPTVLMGMSLPFLVRAMVREVATAGRTIGYLYGINVLGASLGAFATPWVLIRFFGIRGAVLAAVAGNVTAGLLALILGRRFARGPAQDVAAGSQRPEPIGPESRPPRLELPGDRPFVLWVGLYSLSGFCALSLEILWFRVIDVAVKSTAFTFGTVLGIYLLGLALGSLAGARLVGRVLRPLKAFLFCQCLLLAYSGAALLLLARMPRDAPWISWYFAYWGRIAPFRLEESWNVTELLRLYVVLPAILHGLPTLLMGFSYPILQRAVQDDPRTSGRKVGTLQAANIAGCTAGSLLVGLLALSALGTMGTLRVLMAGGLLFAAIGIRYYGPRLGLAGMGAALGAFVLFLPGQQDLWLRLHGQDSRGLVEEDATSTAAILPEGPRNWRVFVNGKSHSWLPFGGVHTRLGALPAIIHPEPREVAVIGLGSGDTAWASACRKETRSVRVFEISGPQPRLLARLAEEETDDPSRLQQLRDFLHDPRVRVQIADGRNALARGDALYDLIVVDALRPEMSYSGNLYSLEFFALCAQRLKPGGIMCSWAPTPRVDRTFRRAFPHVMQIDAGRILLGSNERVPIDRDAWSERLHSEPVMSYLGGPGAARLILRYLRTCERVDRPPEAADLNRDLFPRDEFSSP